MNTKGNHATFSIRALDWQRARAETRGCENVVHFNNAGASLQPAPVIDAVRDYLADEEMQGGYETVEARYDQLERFYTQAAQMLNAQPEEIAFMYSATHAWQAMFYAFPLKPGDKVLTSCSDYGSNVVTYLQRARQAGCEIEFVQDDAYGQIDVRALAAQIDEQVKLIAISHIPTGGGLVNPAAGVGEVAKAAGVAYLLDACQSVGQMPMDVEEIGCDMLSATGRKYLRGPRGTGLLYVRKAFLETLQPAMLDQFSAPLEAPDRYVTRDDARRFESWERSSANQLGLATAINYALAWGLDAIQARVYALADNLRAELAAVAGVEVTDLGRERCGIVTFIAEQKTPLTIKAALADKGINVSVSTGSGSRVDFSRRGLDAVVRASVHYYNSEDEIARFLSALKSVLEGA